MFKYIQLGNYCTKTETDDLDNELPTLFLNTYNNSKLYTLNILIPNWV